MSTVKRTFGAGRFSASKWVTVFDSMWEKVKSVNGQFQATPKLHNRDAVSLIRAWKGAKGSTGSSHLWSQFAAEAYGWDPNRGNYMRRDDKQGDAWYPEEFTSPLWSWARGIAEELDARNETKPSLSVSADDFRDPKFCNAVMMALAEDGYDVQFKIPLPGCRDTKTGKTRVPYLPCDDDGKGKKIYDPATGRWTELPCDKPGDCEVVTIDDPITALIGHPLRTLAFILVAAWILTGEPRRVRRSS